MSHYRPRHPARYSEQLNLLDDAQVLIDRYKKRNAPGSRLDAGERKAWAGEVVEALERLRHEGAAHIGPPDSRDDKERRKVWLELYVNGYRLAKPLDSDPAHLKLPSRPLWRRAFDPDENR